MEHTFHMIKALDVLFKQMHTFIYTKYFANNEKVQTP